VQDLEREIRETNIRLCLDCGKCTVVCPVAQYDPAFNPRLIAQRRLSQSSQGPRDETIWSCLSCYMCVERCNYHVKFPRFIHALRAESLAEGAQIQCSHGEALQTMMHLMARENLQQKRLNWLPEDVNLSPQSDTLFFVGCAPYFDVLFSDLGVNTLDGVKGALKLLNRAQIPFNIMADERCCGRDLLLQGDRKGFAALAKANIEQFARYGVKRIITNCPECYYTLKVDYPNMLGVTGIEVVHLSQMIAPLVKGGKLSLGKLEKRVTYQDPCTLGRCSRIFDEPRQILGGVAGLKLVEMEQSREKALCCGATSWLQCGAVNRQIQRERFAQAEASGAEILVTACPKCQIHLRCAQKNSDGKAAKVEIQDLASLAAQSLD
jgi:heterodisulfide reductase subunit D